MTRQALLIAALAAAGVAGCSDAASVTGPTEITLSTRYFTGTLAPGAVRFYSFTIARPGGTATVLLASVTSPATGAAVSARIGLGLGVPAGTGCALTKSVETTASLQAQLSDSFAPGVYCVSISDAGSLTAHVNFAIRFTHP